MLVARDEVTIRERGSPPWAFALAQVRIRSADGQSQSIWVVMLVASGGQNGSHDTGVPSRGLAQALKKHLVQLRCVVGNGGLVLVAKSPRIGKCGPRKA